MFNLIDSLTLIGCLAISVNVQSYLFNFLGNIQIVGMSATIGNLPQIAEFLQAEVFERQFRPVELTEYVKLGDMLHKIVWGANGMEVVPDRKLDYGVS